ncbi:hypothetical protein [Sphingomonas sp. BAUL-RG-20F-R05-02]|uniref:hypothetical protein n=1 Tax=Sphingomonas sp. BAUL-RG-20F-R05-02 TaxID=2914830 RepID=UPI001F5669AB|nr:hypothetical protein [Sphingomonas sp. BAUL-RG-20F-R05-02]
MPEQAGMASRGDARTPRIVIEPLSPRRYSEGLHRALRYSSKPTRLRFETISPDRIAGIFDDDIFSSSASPAMERDRFRAGLRQGPAGHIG